MSNAQVQQGPRGTLGLVETIARLLHISVFGGRGCCRDRDIGNL